MHEIIRKIEISPRQRTSVVEEREVFAKMEADQHARRKRLRRERLLSALRLRRRDGRPWGALQFPRDRSKRRV